MHALASPTLNADQRKDLVTLLSTAIVSDAVFWMVESVLGRKEVANLGNTVSDRQALSDRAIDLLDRAGKLQQGIDLLLATGARNTLLAFGLNCILRDERLDMGAMQSFTNDYEPFMSTVQVGETMHLLRRVVCAIGLSPLRGIVGTGFLIGPDLVITNYHVLRTCLAQQNGNGRLVENCPGTDIHCFFDYLREPAPMVPAPVPFNHHTVCVKATAQNWLVHARPNLVGEGGPNCQMPVDNELDYAVFKLEQPIGEWATRAGGGTLRGWVNLQAAINPLDFGRRLMVFQHPAGVAQQFDIGAYSYLKVKDTRVWYTVSAAKGSSGGATVGVDGELFALHNAEVLSPPAAANERLNQGVRIDHITSDLLTSVPGWRVPPGPVQTNLGYWSLNDDPLNPVPIIGRRATRDMILRMNLPNGKRALMVRGPVGSGVRFSVKLLRRVLGMDAPVIVFKPQDLEQLEPKDFLDVLVDQLGLTGLANHPVPEPRATENTSRWLRTDLPEWLFARLSEDAARRPSRYPAWIVIDAMMPADQRLRWAKNLKDMLAALVGVRDPGETAADVTQLRWSFLSNGPPPVPLTDVSVEEDILTSYDEKDYTEDFSLCMQLAWRCIDPNAVQNDHQLRAVAAFTADNSDPTVPIRKRLANLVRGMLVKARVLPGGP